MWIDVDEKSLLDGVPRLTEKSRLLCKHGGEIGFGKGNPYGIEDFLQRDARWISPENGEMIYDCGNLLKSGRGAIESKKIMDIVSSGKDFNDVLDETQKKIEKYNEDIDAAKKNVIEYVNDGTKEFRRYIPEHVGEKKNQYPTDVKVDKNLGVLFDVFR